MDAATIALVLAVAGVNFGWRPVSDGPAGYEYIVQIEPEIADLLRRGEEVPIVSRVPPEVSPIRTVRIVVGRGEMVRAPLAADSAKLEKYVARDVGGGSPPADDSPSGDESMIVRGQSPDDRYGLDPPASPPQVDRYGNPIGEARRGAAQPGLLGRVENAVSETAGALRDGLEAGFQEANEQLSRAGRAVGGSLGRGTTGEPHGIGTTGEPAAIGATGAPPVATGAGTGGLPIAGSAITQTPSGWTSIGGSVAAPPVWSPPLLGTGGAGGGDALVMQTGGGPTFPLPGDDGREPLLTIHGPGSAGAPGSEPAPPSSDPFASSGGSELLDLVPVRPIAPRVPETQPAGSLADPWDGDWLSQPPPTSPSEVDAVVETTPPTEDVRGEPAAEVVTGPATRERESESPRHPGAGEPPAAATAATAAEPVPWKPLLLTSLGLVGSLGANLFLGWSYLDARQRYRALVRRTAESFRRRSGKGE